LARRQAALPEQDSFFFPDDCCKNISLLNANIKNAGIVGFLFSAEEEFLDLAIS
jgi:hypothetical protein